MLGRGTVSARVDEHVFVLGGTGLLGAEVASQFHDAGNRVTIVARHPFASERAVEGCEAIEGDAANAELLTEIVEQADHVAVTLEAELIRDRSAESGGREPVHLADVVIGRVFAQRFEVRAEADRAALTFKTAAEEAARLGGESIPLDLTEGNEGRWGLLQRFPVGPVLAITPFNFPPPLEQFDDYGVGTQFRQLALWRIADLRPLVARKV